MNSFFTHTLRARGLWALVVVLGCSAAMAEVPIVDTWRFTTEKPAAGWQEPAFDDSAWTEGRGGFGTPNDPKLRVDTDWETEEIWLRKTMELATVPDRPALYISHNEDAVVYLNGKQIGEFDGVTHRYQLVPLDADEAGALRTGPNVLAAHCRNKRGIQFIDVHLAQGEDDIQLPPTERERSVFKSELVTTWGTEVTAENAWTEYPRPQLAREAWENLNGLWQYAVTPIARQEAPETWEGEILVPFALESRLSGVQRALQPEEALWYRRSINIDPAAGMRTLLNFEAVDYRSQVWVNGQAVGSHQGGNTPFTFDITDAVQAGANELLVRVEDATEAWQLRGKQVLDPNGIWYTRVSGIWQTVWLEQVNPAHIEDLHFSTDAAAGSIQLAADVKGAAPGMTLRVVVKDDEATVAEMTGPVEGLTITLENAKRWSPSSPHLYPLEIELLDAAGNAVDRVSSYAGIRTIGKTRDADGHLRFTLNGESLFHLGPLDQGWWPDGLLTPPSDEAMQFDIEYLKSAGFNMIRKHIKVEPRRYYYHCDRLGMMLWQDQPSGGAGPPWTRMQPDPEDAQWPDEHHAQYMTELESMIDSLENHPSIVVWVPFNEAWGQHRSEEVGRWIEQRDPSRLVNIASGGNFFPVGHIADHHEYPHPIFPFDAARFGDFVQVVGEFGGHGYPVEGHLWNPAERNWGYGQLPESEAEYKERYRESIRRLRDLRDQGVAGGVYTQTTDVEIEINGLLTYDRKVIKLPAQELAEVHQVLFAPPAAATE